MRIACIIVHFGQEKYLQDCLASLKRVKKENFKLKIIIIDNNKNNLGFAGGANKGIKKALKDQKTKYILLLNNDTVVEKNALNYLLETAKKEKIGIIGPQILSKQGKTESLGGKLDKKRFTSIHIKIPHMRNLDSFFFESNSLINSLDFIPGTAMLIKRAVFEKLPSFDERFFLYYEDVDFCLRAQKRGFKLAINPKAIVSHTHSASAGRHSPLKQYYLARNHLLLVEKHAPLKIKLREFFRLPKTLFKHWEKREKAALWGIRDYFLRRFGRQSENLTLNN